jgi:molybdopterin-containing oxidoreductase family membrane subunit
MWLERFMIVTISLTADYLPSSWGLFIPTGWDWGILFGSIGLFLVLMFLFIRTLPMISIFEVREFLAEKKEHGHPAETGAEA